MVTPYFPLLTLSKRLTYCSIWMTETGVEPHRLKLPWCQFSTSSIRQELGDSRLRWWATMASIQFLWLWTCALNQWRMFTSSLWAVEYVISPRRRGSVFGMLRKEGAPCNVTQVGLTQRNGHITACVLGSSWLGTRPFAWPCFHTAWRMENS